MFIRLANSSSILSAMPGKIIIWTKKMSFQSGKCQLNNCFLPSPPVSYACRNANAPTRNFLHQVALRAGSQIAKYRGTVYTVGTSANILYEASGGLDDYAYGNLGIPMSFTLELPGENFQVATSDIIHICKETFAGFVEFVRHVSLY